MACIECISDLQANSGWCRSMSTPQLTLLLGLLPQITRPSALISSCATSGGTPGIGAGAFGAEGADFGSDFASPIALAPPAITIVVRIRRTPRWF